MKQHLKRFEFGHWMIPHSSRVPASTRMRKSVLMSFVEASIIDVCGNQCKQLSDENEKTVAFLLDQQGALPHVLSPLMKLATIIFDLSTLPFYGRRFQLLPLAARRHHLKRWRASRVQAFRNFVKFHEALAAFHFHFERQSMGGD